MLDQVARTHGRDTVIFDGECGVCNKTAGYLQAKDAARRLAFVPFQSADLERISPGLTSSMTSRAMYIVELGGRRYGGARAMFALLRRLPGFLGVIGKLGFLLPLSLLAEPFYRVFAHNRRTISRWLGLAQCPIPESIERPHAGNP